MKIGFDLDKVLIDYPPLIPPQLIDRLYKEKDNGVLLYRIPGAIEQKLRLITHYPLFRKPIQKNLSFVRNLAQEKKYEIFLVSSRFGFLEKITKQLMKKHRFSDIFTHTFFNFGNIQPHIFKNTVIKKEQIERFIDDDISLLKYLAKENPKTLFFWLNSNIDGKRLLPNLYAITHIQDSLTTYDAK